MAWNLRRRRSASTVWAFVSQNPALSVLVIAALGLLIANRFQPGFSDSARGVADDLTSSVMETFSGPVAGAKRWLEGVGSFFDTYEENQRLRDENAKLRLGQEELIELRRKVARFEQLLKIPADAAVSSVAARVIADTSSPFLRTMIINTGADQGVEKGQAVVDERGLLGRVIGTGQRSSRVLLLNDVNSRIPVIIEGANLKAILVGDNSERPTLEYLPPGSRLTSGARVLTTADGATLPPGIVIGSVVKGETSPRVELSTSEGRADFVRVMKYQAPVDVDTPATDAPDGKVPLPASPRPSGASPALPRPNTALIRFESERVR